MSTPGRSDGRYGKVEAVEKTDDNHMTQLEVVSSKLLDTCLYSLLLK